MEGAFKDHQIQFCVSSSLVTHFVQGKLLGLTEMSFTSATDQLLSEMQPKEKEHRHREMG